MTPPPQMLQVNNLNRLNAQNSIRRDEQRQHDTSQAPVPYETLNAAYEFSPDDPLNPRNFSPPRLIFTISLVTLLAFLATFTGAIYAPASDSAIPQEFNTSSHEIDILPLALYNLGLAFGPLVGAPLSETYGRKAVFIVSTLVFAAFTLGAGFSQTITQLIVTRFFAGMFGSPLINNASAAILDCTDSRYRGVSLGLYYALPSVGTLLGPLSGGFIVNSPALGWRWTQWICAAAIVALAVPVCFTRETYKKVILQRRAVRLGLQDSSSTSMGPARAIRYFATTLVQRPIRMLFTEPIVALVSLYNGFLFGLLYTFVVASPWIYEHYYDYSVSSQSLTFIGLSIGTLLAALPLVLSDMKYYQPRLSVWQQTHGTSEPFSPRHRLIPGMAGSVLLPPALFIVAWTSEFRLNPFLVTVFQGVVMFSSLLIYASANLFMLDAYGPLYGASASGAMMLTRYTLSTVFPLFSLQMYKALGSGWATSILGFVTLLMAPTHWVFWWYGERLKARSRYELSQ